MQAGVKSHLSSPKSSEIVEPATQYPTDTSAWNHLGACTCVSLNSEPAHGRSGGEGEGEGGGEGLGGGKGGGGNDGGGGGGGEGGEGGGEGGWLISTQEV